MSQNHSNEEPVIEKTVDNEDQKPATIVDKTPEQVNSKIQGICKMVAKNKVTELIEQKRGCQLIKLGRSAGERAVCSPKEQCNKLTHPLKI